MGLTIFADKNIVTNQYANNYTAVVNGAFRCSFFCRIFESTGLGSLEYPREGLCLLFSALRALAPSNYSGHLPPGVLGAADRRADWVATAECVAASGFVAPLRSTLKKAGGNVSVLSGQ